jgi:methyl-accepting chemotaxis protein-1 (serine sensor receptor)
MKLNITIKSRIGGAMALLALLMIVIGSLGIYGLSSANDSLDKSNNDLTPGMLAVSHVETSLLRERISFDRAMITLGTPTADIAIQQSLDSRALVDKYWKEYLALPKLQGEAALADTAYGNITTLHQVLDAGFAAIRQKDNAAAMILFDKLPIVFTEALKADAALADFQKQAAAKGYDDAVSNYHMVRNVSIAAIVGGLFIAMVTWFSLSRAIGVPLADALAHFDAIAAGDLRRDVQVTSNDEMGQLLSGLAKMRSSLVDTVRTVRSGSDAIASATQEIAAGNLDLSSRTEEQASALQQTAASMEQLTGTVKQNADNASQASKLAESASHIANSGSEVVAKVVTTMREINDSSSKIADIISIIEGIAFQTNILALNAAVEAARAGEEGRGFAVVAGEVRTLAQRSSAAAKEIKGLIDTSVDRVQSGTALVDNAGRTMTEIIGAVQRVTDIMGEIAAASKEQSGGIDQVALAVGQMDEATQQNAALVEEATAASQSLEDQADKLREAVAVFSL